MFFNLFLICSKRFSLSEFASLKAIVFRFGGVGGLIGAAQKAGTAYNTFKNVNLRSVVNADVNQAVNNTIRGALPGVIRGASSSPLNSPLGIPTQPVTNGSGGIFFPTPPVSTRSPNFNPSLSGGR